MGALQLFSPPEIDASSHRCWFVFDAWGTVAQTPRETDTLAELTVFGGRLKIRRLVFTGTGSTEELDLGEIKGGETRQIVVSNQ